jgi:molybdate transport system regulatory protein
LVPAGSISQAARDAGVSYKAAWQAIDTLTNLAGVALVERAVGGAGGGGAQLTAQGWSCWLRRMRWRRARGQVLARLQAPGSFGGAAAAVHPHQHAQPAALCSDRPRRAGAIVRVQLALADGAVLVARITRESVELLGLRPGRPWWRCARRRRCWCSRLAAPGRRRPPTCWPAARAACGAQPDEGRRSGRRTGRAGAGGVCAAAQRAAARGGVVLQVDEAAMVLALAG